MTSKEKVNIKIAIIGPPGSGKTTICTGLYYFLKTMRKKVELVAELIKHRVYSGEDFMEDGFDIWNTLEQKKFESNFYSANLDFLICEAPLCNGYFYASFYEKKEEAAILKKIAKNHINNYDIILKLNFNETADSYETFGRKENYIESKKLNDHIFEEFSKLGFKGCIIEILNRDELQKVIADILAFEQERKNLQND